MLGVHVACPSPFHVVLKSNHGSHLPCIQVSLPLQWVRATHTRAIALLSVKRDLFSVKRDLISVKRDLITRAMHTRAMHTRAIALAMCVCRAD